MRCLADWSNIELNDRVHSRCTDILTLYVFSDTASLSMSSDDVEKIIG